MKKCVFFSLVSAIIISLVLPQITEPQDNIIYLHEQEQRDATTDNTLSPLIQMGNVLVMFYAEWCGPCNRMSPIIDEIARDLREDFTIIKVNIDYYRPLFKSYGFTTVPAILFFKDGLIVHRQSQSTTKKELQKIIDLHYKKSV